MGKGANQNMGAGGVQQAQMNLVPPYQPPSMGGKGGMQQQPPNMSNFQQPDFSALTGLLQAIPAQQPTQQPVTSPQPLTVAQPGGPGYQPGSPGYRPTIDNTGQFAGTAPDGSFNPPTRVNPQPAIPDFLRPYVNKVADRMPRPSPGGFMQPTRRPDPFQNFMQRRNDFINSDNDLNTIRYQQMVLEDKMRRQQAAQQPAAPTDMPAEGADPATADPAMAQPQPPAFDEGMMNQMDMLNQQYMNRLNQSPFGRPMGRFGPFGRFPGMGGKGARRPLFGRFGPSMGGFEGARLQGGTGTDMQRGTTASNRLGQLFGLGMGGINPFSR
tara:strand:- start:1058 stop:2035 length:978 start_codon:yes stop_codon:yes gene_type:complete